jgi:chloramphenicol 3-O phosphotransferase
MESMGEPGWIVILNGAPRSGKSSIVAVIQETFEGPWMNLGVDVFSRSVTPPGYRPGMGLRPGAARPEIESLIPSLYAAFYDSIAAHSRHGLNVVVDVGHHDALAHRHDLLRRSLGRLAGLPVLLVGVHCPIEVIMQRRAVAESDRPGVYFTTGRDERFPDPVVRWQREVHDPGIYDIEVDTSQMTPDQCAEVIGRRLSGPPPTAVGRILAAGDGDPSSGR